MSFSRREFLKRGVAATLGAIAAGDLDAVSGSLSGLARDALTFSLTGTDSVVTDAMIQSSGRPTVIVSLTDGDDAWSNLEDWAEGDGRELLDRDETSDAALVAAPESDIASDPWELGSDLASRDYVDIVDLNVRHETATVDQLAGSDSWPDLTTLEQFRRYRSTQALPDDGVAFDDVEPTDLQPALEGLNARNLSPGSALNPGPTPTVGVIDTGINTATGDSVFGGRISADSKNFIDDETGVAAIEDGNGHGTFVAAEMAGDPPTATHQGVLPTASIVGGKALADDGSGSTWAIRNAIRYVADQGVDVICMSLGSPVYSVALDRATAYAEGEDAICFVAAGNDRYGTRWVGSPASVPGSISVASVTAEADSADVRSSYFSNVGPHPGTTDFSAGATEGAEPDVAAPGHKVTTTVAQPDGATAEKTLTGTSMACPIAAAIAAARIADDSDLQGDVEATRTAIQDTAEPLEQVAVAEVGAGRIDGQALLDESVSDSDQDSIMSTAARQRDSAYRAESATTRWLSTFMP